jgi:hypothetical protein
MKMAKLRTIIIIFLSGIVLLNCTLKQGKKPYLVTGPDSIRQTNYIFNENERKNIKGEKLNFTTLTYIKSDGTRENINVNSTIAYNDKVLDISTKEPVKHFPYTLSINSFSKSDSGIAINMEQNNFIRKVFIRKDMSAAIAVTTKIKTEKANKQVVKMIFGK